MIFLSMLTGITFSSSIKGMMTCFFNFSFYDLPICFSLLTLTWYNASLLNPLSSFPTFPSFNCLISSTTLYLSGLKILSKQSCEMGEDLLYDPIVSQRLEKGKIKLLTLFLLCDLALFLLFWDFWVFLMLEFLALEPFDFISKLGKVDSLKE